MTWLEQYWLQLLFVLAYLALLIHHCWKGKQETHGMADLLLQGVKGKNHES